MDVSDLQAAFNNLVTASKSLLEAHPDLESDAATSFKDTVNTVAPLVEHTVDAVATPTLADAIDAAISKVQADADAAAAQAQSDAQARIAALNSLKS